MPTSYELTGAVEIPTSLDISTSQTDNPISTEIRQKVEVSVKCAA